MSGRRRAGSVVKGVGAVAATAAAAGLTYQTLAAARDAHRFPPPGRLIDVGGHRLHLTHTGSGGPAVVLDAGLAGFSLDWGLVTPEVAAFTSVCAYDRAGYGWSDPGPLPRTSSRIACELHTLLHRAGIEPPYILVGHSFGGFNVRLFAEYYPDEVAGMVLVDVSHEDLNNRLPPEICAGYERYERAEVPLLRLGAFLARFGVVRLAVERGWLTLLDSLNALPPRQLAMARALRYRPRFLTTAALEDVTFNESGEQARNKGNIGDRPLIVLTGAGQEDVGTNPLPFMDLSRFGEALRVMTAVKTALHAELAATLSTNGTHVVTAKSGHMIQLSEPELVISAIHQVVAAARADAPT